MGKSVTLLPGGPRISTVFPLCQRIANELFRCLTGWILYLIFTPEYKFNLYMFTMNLLSNPRIGWSALSFVFVTTLFSCAKTASTQNNSNKPDSNSSPNTPPVPAKKWVVSTLAGSGRAGFADGDSSQAAFNNPQGIATDNQGNIYVGDVGNASIRKITPAGSVITYANNAISNPALAFGNIAGLAVDQQGGLYDIEYGIIRKTVSSTA